MGCWPSTPRTPPPPSFPKGKPLRIVLIGKGTSAAGNIILRTRPFPSKPKSCVRKTMTKPRQIEVIIPSDKAAEDLNDGIVQCIKHSCPGPHAFLLVIQMDRLTKKEEQDTVEALQEIFVEKAAHYIIVLFTNVNNPKGQGVYEYVRKVHPKLIASCGGRHHVFNYNKTDRTQVVNLVKKIDTMVAANKGGHFTEEML